MKCLTILITFAALNAFAADKLVFAIDLIRHGDRTPLQEIPKSPYVWKEGLGALTEKGKNQELQLGKALRRKYVTRYHLLPAHYTKEIIYVRSTDTNRTVESAYSFLLGLYPLKVRAINIPINTVIKKRDYLLVVKPSRTILSLLYFYFCNRKAWQEKTVNLQDKLKNWRKLTGLSLDNFNQLAHLADNLRIRQIHHVSLPKGISGNDTREIISLGKWAMVNYFKLKQISYPMGHEFISVTKNYFEQVMSKKTRLKYVLFSSHDSSIMSVMNTLGTPLENPPRYAAHLNFALFKNNKNYYIKISYNDKPIAIPACGGNVCSLSQFYRLA